MLFMTTIDSRLLGDSVSRTKGIFMIEKKSKGNANIFWKVTLNPLLADRISKASHPNQVLTLSSFFLFPSSPFFLLISFPFFFSFFKSCPYLCGGCRWWQIVHRYGLMHLGGAFCHMDHTVRRLLSASQFWIRCVSTHRHVYWVANLLVPCIVLLSYRVSCGIHLLFQHSRVRASALFRPTRAPCTRYILTDTPWYPVPCIPRIR